MSWRPFWDVFGGLGEAGECMSSVFRYDPREDLWEEIARMPTYYADWLDSVSEEP